MDTIPVFRPGDAVKYGTTWYLVLDCEPSTGTLIGLGPDVRHYTLDARRVTGHPNGT